MLVLGGAGELNAAARTELTGHLHPCRVNSSYEVIQNAVDNLLIESGIVAEGNEVVLEALCLHHFFCRGLGDGQLAAVRLPGDGSEGGKLVRGECYHVGALRAAVGECLQLSVLGAAEKLGVLAEQ